MKNKKEYFLTLQRGAYGFFVSECWIETNKDHEDFMEVEFNRCKPAEIFFFIFHI